VDIRLVDPPSDRNVSVYYRWKLSHNMVNVTDSTNLTFPYFQSREVSDVTMTRAQLLCVLAACVMLSSCLVLPTACLCLLIMVPL
jgi:hypothetical protein